MQTKSKHIIVHLPNEAEFDVSYYCSDKTLPQKDRKTKTKLHIQLHDCLCTLVIDKAICSKQDALQTMVHNKVINTKGHLC